MELSPQSVASTSFKTVKKGYDPNEVRSYLETLSKSIESLQSQATAMEARARAAVARLQELAAQPAPKPSAEPAATPEIAEDTSARSLIEAHVDEAETISRTLLLAQRTADTTVAQAEAEAKRITDAANDEARLAVRGAQEAAGRMVEEARAEARRAGESQRIEVESEVQSLLARREFLVSDVDHLELHIVTQRDRLREVAASLTDMVDRVPGGLGDIRRPLISAVEFDASSASGSDSVDGPADTIGADFAADTVDSHDTVAAARPNHDDAVGGDQPAQDGTPPSGQPNRFLFEDITAEVPSVTGNGSNPTSSPSSDDRTHGDLTIRGDELH